jgi:hypothetical protein
MAREIKVSEPTIWKHWNKCISIDLEHMAEQGNVTLNLDAIAGQLQLIYNRTVKFLGDAEEAEDYRLAASMLREARQSLDVLAKVAGQQSKSPEKVAASDRPDIDSAIAQALSARYGANLGDTSDPDVIDLIAIEAGDTSDMD